MIKEIIISCIFGIFVMLWYAQSDPWVKCVVGDYFIRICESALECRITGEVTHMSIFWPSITLKNVHAMPRNGSEWHWDAQVCTVQCTWSSLLGSGLIDLYIWCSGFELVSQCDRGNLALIPYIRSLCAGTAFTLPVFLKQMHVDGMVSLCDDSDNIQASFYFKGDAKKIEDALKATVAVQKGSVIGKQAIYVSELDGNFYLDAHKLKQNVIIAAEGKGRLILNHLDNDSSCFYSCAWNKDQGNASLWSNQRSCMMDVAKISIIDDHILGTVKIHLPLSYCARVMGHTQADKLQGGATMHVLFNTKEAAKEVHGNITLQNISYNDWCVCDTIQCSFSRSGTCWKGGIQSAVQHARIAGSWSYDGITHYGNAYIENVTDVRSSLIKNWSLLPQDAAIAASWHEHALHATYRATITNLLSDVTHTTSGTVDSNNGTLLMQGTCGQRIYQAELQCAPHINLKNISYGAPDNQPLLFGTHRSSNNNRYTATIDFSLLREWIHYFFDYDVIGDGALTIAVSRECENQLAAKISLLHGTIRLPYTYNSINHIEGIITADWIRKKLVIRDAYAQLHRGTLYVPRAVWFFDDEYALTFAHVPLQFESCLLNIKRDLFALLSGSLLYTQSALVPLIKGTIIVDRAQFNDNVFSDALLSHLKQPIHSIYAPQVHPYQYDITIATKNAISVCTPFVQTQARINAHVGGTRQDPRITGIISCMSGALNFPYKPLYITKGTITFNPDHSENPFIDLVAQSKIRNYHLFLHATGTRNDPLIAFTSSPSLTEEQCIALLFTGVPEESLNIVMPALLMQNIRSMLFGNRSALTPNNSYVASFLKPFEYIYLLPRLSDQTGRGGIRGALEIALGERWRFLIQQNFSLSEDTRFELEYLASDNLAFRAFRDERRDIGGEIEIRLKQ